MNLLKNCWICHPLTSWNVLALAHYVWVCHQSHQNTLAWCLTQHNEQGLDHYIVHLNWNEQHTKNIGSTNVKRVLRSIADSTEVSCKWLCKIQTFSWCISHISVYTLVPTSFLALVGLLRHQPCNRVENSSAKGLSGTMQSQQEPHRLCPHNLVSAQE